MDSNELPAWSRSPLLALAALWAMLLFVVSLIEYPAYLHDPAVPVWEPVTLAGVPTGVLLLWFIAELRSARYIQLPLEPARAWFLNQSIRLPLVIAGYVLIVVGVHRELFMRGVDPDPLVAAMRVPFEIFKCGLFCLLWLGLVYGTLSLITLREKSAQFAGIQKALLESQLAQLQAQLRPHFLFNTLNTVSALMQIDLRRADRMLTQLGDLLRANLGAEKSHEVPLRRELELLRMYTDIMVERFFDRARVEWEIAENALGVAVPALLLQPLVENAFQYGIERTTGRECIRVSASCQESRLQIVIFNTGSTLRTDWAAGVGLTNCQERLSILYGRRATLTLANAVCGVLAGVAASITVPLTPGTA